MEAAEDGAGKRSCDSEPGEAMPGEVMLGEVMLGEGSSSHVIAQGRPHPCRLGGGGGWEGLPRVPQPKGGRTGNPDSPPIVRRFATPASPCGLTPAGFDQT